MRVSGLSKNATVNHLTKLMGMGMVRRVSRGQYSLTQDGRGLILTGTRLYNGSCRGELERERMRQLYMRGGGEGMELGRKIVDRKGTYLCCWISFNGAVGGVLRAMGVEYDVVDVAGHSGYAFLMGVPVGRMCPSVPTSFPVTTYREFARGVSAMGIEAEILSEEGGYMCGESASFEDQERACALFKRVREAIDVSGRPVVLWGLPIPEFSIVNGYEGERYVASTYRSPDPAQGEELVPALGTQSPGCLMMVTFSGPASGEDTWLERAVRMASGKADVCQGYVSGPKAAQEWSFVLLRVGDDEYMGNSYTAACYAEGRSNAGVFLKRMARSKKGRSSRELMDASTAYARGAQVMEEYVRLFPFNFQGKLSEDSRVRDSNLLLELKEHEESAVMQMREALSRWP
jgi:hypothetical protein